MSQHQDTRLGNALADNFAADGEDALSVRKSQSIPQTITQPDNLSDILARPSYGHLSVVVGPMFAGKSTELLKRILWAKNGRGQRVKVYKPAFDQRYSQIEIMTHGGLASQAEAIVTWQGQMAAIDAEQIQVVFLDEIQFFEAPNFSDDIVEIVTQLLQKGVDVVVSGLDMDWRGAPFPISASLSAMSDEVLKLRGICSVCGRPSTRSFKKTGEGEQVELGGADKYESRCTHHWAAPDQPLTQHRYR